jgi:hypothetical protein
MVAQDARGIGDVLRGATRTVGIVLGNEVKQAVEVGQRSNTAPSGGSSRVPQPTIQPA